jgi:hypothetical protein
MTISEHAKNVADELWDGVDGLPECAQIVQQAIDAATAELRAENERLRDVEKRFMAMLPLFQEARDALPAISSASMRLRGLDPMLADRMDDVGIPDRWKAKLAREAKATE